MCELNVFLSCDICNLLKRKQRMFVCVSLLKKKKKVLLLCHFTCFLTHLWPITAWRKLQPRPFREGGGATSINRLDTFTESAQFEYKGTEAERERDCCVSVYRLNQWRQQERPLLVKKVPGKAVTFYQNCAAGGAALKSSDFLLSCAGTEALMVSEQC